MGVKQGTNLGLSQSDEASFAQTGDTCHIMVSPVTATASPMDSADRVDSAILLDCVAEEVSHFYESGEVANFKAAPNQRELLGVLTFAYARRLYASEEIAHLCQSDAGYRRLCNGHLPFADELVSFRRHHRPLLITVLANVIMRTSRMDSRETQPATAAAFKRQLLCQATERLDTARHLDTGNE